jgi:hypothetical protein
MILSYNLALLSMLSIFVILISLPPTLQAQENATESNKSSVPKFIAIQHAQSGSIYEINSSSYSLELNDVSDKTILFSDRPDRIVTSVTTDNFIGNWSVGSDSFTVDPPNAVLVIDDVEGQNDIIIELVNPLYDVDKRTLIYEIKTETIIPTSLREFGSTTLIIDASVAIGMSNSGTF